MNILVLDSWLREFLKTKATTKQIATHLSLCSQSVERVHSVNNTDWLYEIEITTNRPDCLSVYGIARELAAVLPRFSIPAKLKLIPNTKYPLRSEAGQILNTKDGLPIDIRITNPSLCPRFTALIFNNTKIGPSPKTVQERLEKCGVRALNNIVDISNYLMLELGQPMHTFDYDKIGKAKMVLRESKPGEEVVTLDNQTRQLPKGTIIIEDGDKKVIDLCGIMGGKNSAVDNETKRVLLFVQTYDPARIRRTCQLLGFRTEAASRFEKGVDPEGVITAINRSIGMFEKNCNAQIASSLIDIYPNRPKKKIVSLTKERLDTIMGISFNITKATDILKSLGFQVTNKKSAINTVVPHWRNGDIAIPEDLVEEVARIYGYFNLPIKLPDTPIPQNGKLKTFSWQSKVKNALKFWGFTETVNYSMTNKPSEIKIANPLTEDLTYMRASLLPSLVQVMAKNQDRMENIKIFELANIYTPTKKDQLPKETLMLSGLIQNDNFFVAKGLIETLFEELGITNYRAIPTNNQASVEINGKVVGTYGKMNNKILFFDLNFDELINFATTLRVYKPIPKFPPVIEDFSFVLSGQTTFGDLAQTIKSVSPLVAKVELLDIYQNTRTLRIYFQDPQKTLSEKEVEGVRKDIIAIVEEKHRATIKLKPTPEVE